MNRWNDEVERYRKITDIIDTLIAFFCVLTVCIIIAYIVFDTASCEYVRLLGLLPWKK